MLKKEKILSIVVGLSFFGTFGLLFTWVVIGTFVISLKIMFAPFVIGLSLGCCLYAIAALGLLFASTEPNVYTDRNTVVDHGEGNTNEHFGKLILLCLTPILLLSVNIAAAVLWIITPAVSVAVFFIGGIFSFAASWRIREILSARTGNK